MHLLRLGTIYYLPLETTRIVEVVLGSKALAIGISNVLHHTITYHVSHMFHVSGT